MLTLSRSHDIGRTTAGVVLSAAQPLAAYLSELTGKGMREVDRARESDGPVTPADGTFAIWGPLFLGSLTWAGWSALPEHRNDPALRRIGWFAGVRSHCSAQRQPQRAPCRSRAEASVPYAAAVGWGLAGTAVRNIREHRPAVALAACAGIALLTGITAAIRFKS